MIKTLTDKIDNTTITAHELTVSQYCDLLAAMNDTIITDTAYQEYLAQNIPDAIYRIKQVIKSNKPIEKLNETEKAKALELFVKVNSGLFENPEIADKKRKFAEKHKFKKKNIKASEILKDLESNCAALITQGHQGAYNYGLSFFNIVIAQLTGQSKAK